MAKADRTGRTKGAAQPFVQILKPTLKEPAWRALSYGARCLYIALKSYYRGDNNGRLYLSVRKAAHDLGASPSSTERWFHDLIEHGFIVPTRGGFLGGDGKGTATSWRLTELGFMGEQPTKDYKDWPNIKNRIPYRKSLQTVPKIVADRTENRDGCTEIRDGFGPKSPNHCPENRYISTYQLQGTK